MKRLSYVRKATLTLFEAYPDDPKKGWMPAFTFLESRKKIRKKLEK